MLSIAQEVAELLGQHVKAMQLMEDCNIVQILPARPDWGRQRLIAQIVDGDETATGCVEILSARCKHSCIVNIRLSHLA